VEFCFLLFEKTFKTNSPWGDIEDDQLDEVALVINLLPVPKSSAYYLDENNSPSSLLASIRTSSLADSAGSRSVVCIHFMDRDSLGKWNLNVSTALTRLKEIRSRELFVSF
jgi:hypothetical protein